MPLITIRTSLKDGFDEIELLNKLSKELSNLTGKPEDYVMTLLEKSVYMTFSGNSQPSCFVEVKSIGAMSTTEMSQSLCNLLQKELGIPPSRIYINFENITPSSWGYNGRTF